VRYPEGVTPAAVGRVIRVVGTVDTWYGARQFEAESAPRITGRARVKPVILRHPPTDAHEWRLVRVRVVVTDIERDGDTWRAEARLDSGETLPIVGLAGSEVDADGLEPGRSVRVTGIVRRAHPSASDQRFAVTPRWPRDVQLGDFVADDASVADTGDEGKDADDDGILAGMAGDRDGVDAPAVALGSVAGMVGRVVRVGGRVEDVGMRRLTIDDGTGTGVVRLPAAASALDPALRPGEVINATGRLQRGAGGRPEVVVGTTADLRRAAALVPESPRSDSQSGVVAPVSGELASVPPADGRMAESTGHGPLDPILVVVASLLMLACLGLFGAAAVAWRLSRPAEAAPA
jgi:hypothetical protein